MSCPHCAKQKLPGYHTCGSSYCQEMAYLLTAMTVASKKRRETLAIRIKVIQGELP
jgi:hypothetical protein